MIYDLQKASMWKRISAFLFDFILLGIVAVLFGWALSGALGYNGVQKRLDEAYARYGEEYGIDLKMSLREYEALDDEGRATMEAAYAALGCWLAFSTFSYVAYLAVSLVLACLEAVDELAWTSIYPEVIPLGAEQKGYAVSSMLFTTLVVVMTPFAAVLLDTIGVARLLMIQGALAVEAALIESFVHVAEHEREKREETGLALWASDIREAASWLGGEKGMRGLMGYMAVTNGIGTGYSPILIAFFRTTPGLSAALYALFSAAECIGRTVGSALQYAVKVPREKRFGICLFVYIFYDLMDAVLLWLPYPLMLANRTACGFLGANSYILRESAMQRYIPEHMRSRVNAFQGAFVMAVCSVCALAVGALGEVLDYRMCMTLCGLAAVTASVLLVWMRRGHVRRIFEAAE